MLSENFNSSNVGPRSNTDPSYDYSTMGTTQKKDVNSIYDHTLERMNSSNVCSRNNTDPTYDDSTMCTIQGKDTNNIYDHTLEHMVSTSSNIDDVYAANWNQQNDMSNPKLINMLFSRVTCKDQMLIKYVIMQLK